VLAAALATGGLVPSATAARALVAYGAVILSFLGGIQWGLAIAGGAVAGWGRLGAAVVPALLAWPALLLPATAAYLLLACAFLAVLGADLLLHARGQAPAWYQRLRWPLTTVVTMCLLLAALA
ncbi:MAG: DUF3429 domain-containing protein, partial [Gammaproteobacteria bacterium]